MKKIENKEFIIINLIMIINIIIMFIGGNVLKLKYITLILNLLIIIFAKETSYMPLIMYMHPNSAMYDDIGFTYLFNVTIFLIVLKLIFTKRMFLPKKEVIIFSLILVWEIFLNILDSSVKSNMLSLISWISSYVILIFMANKVEKIDFNKVYKYFFFGFVLSVLAGLSYPINKWGLNIPVAYRFVGLLRDPNYYTVDALFLMFSSFKYKNNNKLNIYFIVAFICGILSVSKMFILEIIIGVVIALFFKMINNKKIRKNTFFKTILMFFTVFSIFVYLIVNTNMIDTMLNKYLYRTGTTSILTGRDYIQKYYINILFDNPKNLLLGNSMLKYSKVLGLGSEEGRSFFENMVAHNTYLDVILSWGIFGALLYLYFIYRIVNLYILFLKEKKIYIEKKFDNATLLICLFLISLFALSYLSVDVFAILMIYLIIFKFSSNNIEKESKNNYENICNNT